MAKRTATTELNHDNWNQEEGPEESGSFSRATEDALKRRVIKVAKRRNPLASVQNEDGKPSAFGGFSGFGKNQPPTTSSSTFGFLTGLANKTETPKTNGTSQKSPAKSGKDSDEYYAKLKGLNESVTEWIKNHVSANPFINLQPVFKDYDKYINDLEKLKNEAKKEKSSGSNTSSTVAVPKFSFGSATSTTTNSSVPTFSFGATSSTLRAGFSFGAASTTPTVSFSSSGSAATLSETFSFGKPTSSPESGKFSFTSTVIKPADTAKSEGAEEEDQPPKVEFTPVVEDGNIYSTRCKVFVKKEGNFADHGVGTLYLKPVPDSKKVQLIVRADTNLGRLICNFILSESIPMQRMGKKDVMLVCIPNPDAQPPPVPILLRVKTSEDADELLKTLQENKK